MRSIATDKSSSNSGGGKASSSSDSDDWGSSSSARSNAPLTPSSQSFSGDSFNIAAWGDSLSAGGEKRGKADNSWAKEVKQSKAESVEAGEPEDFDRYV